MIATLKTWTRVVFTPVHLKRTALIALAIGTWLNVFNHGDELIKGVMNAPLAVKLALNYLTPFIVSTLGCSRTGVRDGLYPIRASTLPAQPDDFPLPSARHVPRPFLSR